MLGLQLVTCPRIVLAQRDVSEVLDSESARAGLDRVMEDLDRPGVVWVTRDGFSAAWSEVHRVESALVDIYTDAELTSLAFDDVLRLRGSGLPNRNQIERKLRIAIRDVDPPSDRFLRNVDIGSPDADGETVPVVTPPDAATEARARAIIGAVHASLTAYRGAVMG